MLLVIDIGNTNLTLGLYEGDKLGAHWRLATDHNRMPDEYGLQFLGLLQNAGKTVKDIMGISLASVVPPLTGRVIQACEEYLKQNKHLPEVPSAKQMEEEGIKLKEMNLTLLKKVEELTLYVIELKKEVDQLKNK